VPGVELHRPGLVPYDQALAWQHERAAAVSAGQAPEALAVLQHPPVFTLGMRADGRHLLTPAAALERRGAHVVAVDRGGDVTFHGPGQLVAYPILDLRARGLGPASYVRLLEAALIETLAAFGVAGERVRGRPGVWAGGAKVAAIGVRIRDGVSTHGLALNVATDLSWFEAIVPCGLPDVRVTSLSQLLGGAPPHEAVEETFVGAFARTFGVEVLARGAEPARAG
jgi:lipoate-protein ligase B